MSLKWVIKGGISVVVEQKKPLLVLPASGIGVPGGIPAVLLLKTEEESPGSRIAELLCVFNSVRVRARVHGTQARMLCSFFCACLGSIK